MGQEDRNIIRLGEFAFHDAFLPFLYWSADMNSLGGTTMSMAFGTTPDLQPY
jgi:hypothetical protein